MFKKCHGSDSEARTYVTGHRYQGELLKTDLVVIEHDGRLVRGVAVVRNGHLEFISAVSENMRRAIEVYLAEAVLK